MPPNHSTLTLDRNTIGYGPHKFHHYINLAQFDGMDEHFYFNKCVCNEIKAISLRHCLEPKPNLSFGIMEREMIRISEFVKTNIEARKSHYEEVMNNTRSGIRARYRRAYYQLKQDRNILDNSFVRAKSFIKYEKMKINKIDAPPRLIQYRDFKYLYLLKSVLLPYALYIKKADEQLYGQRFSTYFTKTMKNDDLAGVLHQAWSDFTDPVGVCLDHSMFDGSITVELKRMEQRYFSECLSSKFVYNLIGYQERNSVITQSGVKYKIKDRKSVV